METQSPIEQPVQNADTAQMSLIERAEKAVLAMQEANKKTEELVKRQEDLKTFQMLGGHSEAGIQRQEVTPDELIKQQTKNFFKGSAIEKAFK